MYRVLVIGKPAAFYWFVDHENLRSSGPQNEAGRSLYLLLRLETDLMLPVSALYVCGVLTITFISCIQRDNLCFKFKHCILSCINIAASKGLEAARALSDTVCAEHVSILWFIGWIAGMDISYQGFLLDETQFYR
jgi:hypothetical protein